MSEKEKIGFFSSLPERERVDVTLPSGRKITVLESTGREEKIASSNRDKSKAHDVVLKYLAGVTENLDDEPGPVPPTKLESLLSGDRIYLLLQVRLLTHGSTMVFKSTCPACKASNEHEIDLQEIVDQMKPYPYGDQREFEVDLGGGVLHYHLPDGHTERRLHQEKQLDNNSKFRCMKLWEVTKHGNLPVSVDSLKSKHLAILRSHLRENECKLDTDIQLICASCGQVTESDVMRTNDFLFPNLT